MPTQPEVLHELVDLVSAVQHVILEPLSELSSHEISCLHRVWVFREILLDTVRVMASIQTTDPSMNKTMGNQITSHLQGSPGWNRISGGVVRTMNLGAESDNEYLKQIPGITDAMIRGFVNCRDYNFQQKRAIEEIDETSARITSRLSTFLPLLKGIRGSIGDDPVRDTVKALYWRVKDVDVYLRVCRQRPLTYTN